MYVVRHMYGQVPTYFLGAFHIVMASVVPKKYLSDAYVVMADVVMAYVAIAFIVMAYAVMG